MDNFFDPDVNEIFEKVGLTKAEAPEFYEEIKTELRFLMASLSSTLGLSYSRVEKYEKQKQSFINDLKKLKLAGTLR